MHDSFMPLSGGLLMANMMVDEVIVGGVGSGLFGMLLFVANPGPHGFSEILYAYTSAAATNGSAFAGLNANTAFYNLTFGLAMFLGRFLVRAHLPSGAHSRPCGGAFRDDGGTSVLKQFFAHLPLHRVKASRAFFSDERADGIAAGNAPLATGHTPPR